jgi:galactokinase
VSGTLEQPVRSDRSAASEQGPRFPDADAFCERVAASAFFAEDAPAMVARAPGRLDVLGGIADYSGSLVLELPLAIAALAAAQVHDDGSAVAVSGARRLALDAHDLSNLPLTELAARFTGPDAWAAYVLGPVALLLREQGRSLPGLRVLVSSELPEGKGLASSAAIGVAVLHAVAGCLGDVPEPRRIALLAQQAEQLLAGAPCGAMDQMTAACGRHNHLLLLLCRPAEIVRSIPLPAEFVVWGIDSGIPHTVAGNAYRRARCAASIGKALLGCDRPYLTELEPSDVDPEQLPEWMTGEDFLRHHRGIDDAAVTLERDAVYPVRAATLHPLEEQVRVRTFAQLLAQPVTDERACLLGELMYQSHAGYSRCGLGMQGTDDLVEAVRAAGWDQGLAGARASAGGSGGTVVVLGRREAEPLVRSIAARLGAGFVRGSSAGAAGFGIRLLRAESG